MLIIALDHGTPLRLASRAKHLHCTTFARLLGGLPERVRHDPQVFAFGDLMLVDRVAALLLRLGFWVDNARANVPTDFANVEQVADNTATVAPSSDALMVPDRTPSSAVRLIRASIAQRRLDLDEERTGMVQ
jgi:hypothetical protein